MPTFAETAQAVIENIEKVIIGKRPQILVALAAILARGHILLEDVPGVAKTMLARSIAVTFGLTFKRVQCTPDLLPSDVTGVSIYNQEKREFEFLPGPVFTNILLADEINRATPRTQSALLEAMEERQISEGGLTRRLPQPFIVMATQNPVEQEGTFPLPEAQLDRFLVRISLGYPDIDQEADMLERLRGGHPLERLKPILNEKTVLQMQQVAAGVFVHAQVRQYLLRIVHGTRDSVKLGLGASPRASIALYRTAQAVAALQGRGYVTPDDVKQLAVPVLAHRLILKPEFRLRKETVQSVVEEVLRGVAAPTNIPAMRPPRQEGPPEILVQG
ncbi:MAG TPA: MoxR family ATPase [Candidatus Sumerlaeota bacterium]|nr:MoxR family ATPase [Candidatus Sumerlaeota bacterium]